MLTKPQLSHWFLHKFIRQLVRENQNYDSNPELFESQDNAIECSIVLPAQRFKWDFSLLH